MGRRKNERVMKVPCPRCKAPSGMWCIWADLEDPDDDAVYVSRKPHDARVEESDRVNPPRTPGRDAWLINTITIAD